jgi:hypothetical protein
MTIAVLHSTEVNTSLIRIFGDHYVDQNLLDFPQLMTWPPTHFDAFIDKAGPNTILAIILTDITNAEVGSNIWKSVATIKHGELLSPSDRLNAWLSQPWLNQDPLKYGQEIAKTLDLTAYRQNINIAFLDYITRRLYLIGYRKAYSTRWTWLSDATLQTVYRQDGLGIHLLDMSNEVARLFMLNNDFIAAPNEPKTMVTPDQVSLILNTTPYAPDQLPEVVQLLGLKDPKHGYHSITTCSIHDSWDSITQLEFYLLDLLQRCHTSAVHDNLYLIVAKPEDIGPLEDQLAISEIYRLLLNHPNFKGKVIPIKVEPPF